MDKSREKSERKKISVKQIVFLQAIVIIYSLSGVFSKLAAEQKIFCSKFFMFYAIEICILGIYALLWQQIIKRVDLSIAYANRAMAIIWSLLWAIIIFPSSAVTLKNIIGVIIILIGTVIVNTEHD